MVAGRFHSAIDRTKLTTATSPLLRDLRTFHPMFNPRFPSLDLVTGRELYSWTGNTATSNNPIQRGGEVGRSLSNKNSELVLPSLFATSTDRGTVSCWFKHNTDDGNLLPVCYIGNTLNECVFMGFYQGYAAIGAQSVTFGVLDLLTENSPSLGTGQWHHVVWQGDKTTWRIWVDGVERTLSILLGGNDAYWASTMAALGISPLDATICRQGDLVSTIDFAVHELGIWDRVITAGEIQQLYRYPDSIYRQRFIQWGDVQIIVPTQIGSAEVFGTAAVNQQIIAKPIDTAEAFGTAKVNQQVRPTGISTAEAFGTAKVNQQVRPTGIPTAEAFGTATVNQQIRTAGIPSAEAFGTAIVTQQVRPTGILTAEVFGTAQVQQQIRAIGIPSAEAFGTAQVLNQIQPSGIPSAEAFGTAIIVQQIRPISIPTAEVFGTAVLTQQVRSTGIPSAEAFGTAIIVEQIRPTGIPSAETFGTAQVNQQVRPTGIASAEAFGNATVLFGQLIQATGIPSAETFGSDRVNQQVRTTGISSTEVLGIPYIFIGAAAIMPARVFVINLAGTNAIIEAVSSQLPVSLPASNFILSLESSAGIVDLAVSQLAINLPARNIPVSL